MGLLKEKVHRKRTFKCQMSPSNEDFDGELTNRVEAAVSSMAKNIVVGTLYYIPVMPYLYHIGKEVLGICNVRLALLRTAILFLREVLLRECSYQSCPRKREWATTVKLIWLMVPIVTISSCTFCCFWLGYWNWLELPSEEYIQDYQFAVKVFGVSCIIEALADPAAFTLPKCLVPYNMLKILDNFRYFMKSSILVVTLWYFPEHTIRATAYGELLIAIVRLGVLWIYFFNQLRKQAELANKQGLHPDNPLEELLLPSIISYSPRRPCRFLIDGWLARRFLQILQKAAREQILVHGERYVITLVPGLSFAEQGIYDTVSELCRCVVINIFYPLRIQSFFFYSSKLPSSRFNKKKTAVNLKKLSGGLFKFLRISTLIGFCVFIFGFTFSPLIAQGYAGSLLVWWPGTLLIKIQFLLVFLKGLSEVTEAYANYSMSMSSLKSYRMMFTKLALVRLLSLGLLIQFIGSIGFAVSNCLLFGCLVLHDVKWFIRRDFEDIDDIPEKPFRGLFPNKTEAAALVAGLLTISFSEWFIYPYSTALHLAFGIISLTWFLGAIIFTEPETTSVLYTPLRESYFWNRVWSELCSTIKRYNAYKS